LVDIFHYDYQEFWFRDGRLLLRGNNGTGKSKVLALTLPFLLDGRTTPSRVEPDGDARKKMEWNLLMDNRYSERTGYSWLEFGRLRQDGSSETFTIGCGMKAVKGRPLDTWFFTTEQRVAQDFSLLDHNKRPLTPNRLKERLGEHTVTDKAYRYRQMVDAKLFQLGEERYDTLINLLIQLRQPQLSKRPDEKALSKALTEALPPLDQGILSDIASAFRNLEAERQELEGLYETARAVDDFRNHYRQYTRVAGRRRAAIVRSAQSKHEKISGELKKAQATHASAKEDEEKVRISISETKTALEAVRVREDTLQQSPEMRNAITLHQAEERAEEKKNSLSDAKKEARDCAEEVKRHQRQANKQQNRINLGKTDINNHTVRLAELAIKLNIGSDHQRLTAPLQLPNGGDITDSADPRLDSAEAAIKTLYQRRGEQIAHIKHLNNAVKQAVTHHQHAQDRWQEASDRLEQLAEAQVEAEISVETQGRKLVNDFFHYCNELHELQIVDPDAIAETLKTWCVTLEGNNPASQALTAAFETGHRQLANEEASFNHQRQQQQDLLDELREEKTRLEAGEQLNPPAPYTREAASRKERLGAPLWQLIDFQDGTNSQKRAAVESALEAGGLLDAWVQPDGTLLDSRTWDSVLRPDTPSPRNLASLLKPAVDRSDAMADAVTDKTLNQLLASIAWGRSTHPAWIDDQGHWRLGPLQGSWQKNRAEYIGHGARETARRLRLEQLNNEIEEIETALADLTQQLKQVAARKSQLDREWVSAPDDEPLRQAHRQVSNLNEQKTGATGEARA
jgi:uncharacterized protein (TIGR02680 family)